MSTTTSKWKNFKVVHQNVLQIPRGKTFLSTPISHFVSIAKKKGRALVVRALLNLERWNKTKNPKLSAHARAAINAIGKAMDKGKKK